jgi:inosose dehydratase
LKVAFHAGAWGADHLFQALQGISKAGIGFVEVYADVAQVYEERADEFLFFLQKAGLRLSGAYGGGVFTDPDFREADVEGARAAARWVRDAGGSTLILQGGEGTGDAHRDLSSAAATANAVGAACRLEGVGFCFQPHAGTVVFREEEVAAFFRETDPAAVGVCLDTGHLAEASVDIVPFVQEHGSRIRVVHLRDLRPKPVFVGGPFANAGKGTVDLVAVVAALRVAGYGGTVVGFADDPREDPAASARDFARFAASKLRLKT